MFTEIMNVVNFSFFLYFIGNKYSSLHKCLLFFTAIISNNVKNVRNVTIERNKRKKKRNYRM